ncbi:ATP-binding cassette domain-containing protein [Micromonospora sp. WMMD882]|uniref:ABC transporter ATP-binding protein n=1 Tax=Micromonospora sp. WMMD882 TaxID=3015151 RepID=UPI00248CBEC2|nr:ATP-binding cassette domain-containing protein [Micromonospora sp. WMMD882]WBB80308.1 ATP-binding cassette domain-containing protein [Micromonospora sp. WMMD882]
MWDVVRAAAPRAAAVVLVAHVLSGVVSALGLLATTDVLAGLLAPGSARHRLAAALPALTLVVVALVVRGALDTVAESAQARLVPTVRLVAEERLVDAALRADLAAFDDPSFYHRLHRAGERGLMRLEESTQHLLALVGAATAMVAVAGTLGVLHPALLPVLLLAALPQGWAVLRSARLEYASQSRTVTLQRRIDMVGELAVRRESAAEIRSHQAEPLVRAEYRQAAGRLHGHWVRLGVAQARTRAVGRALAGVGLAATYAGLGLLVRSGWVPLAVAGAAAIAVQVGASALARLIVAANHLAEQGLYIADYQEFLADAASRARPSTGRPAPAVPARIDLLGVGFRYPGSEGTPPALRGIDLTIRAGETIALVGENGSGKTTLAKLLGGLYRPTSGRITWDGTDLADLDPTSVADRVTTVLQEPVRWPLSARMNVRVGRHDRVDPHDHALLAAARQARADEVVDSLPHGWHTVLSAYFLGGRDLSGGQWQRVAVARGLYRDAPVLIWDEPTAPLDARAEHAVYESLRELAGGRTVVLITHRLASVRHADRIYLLHEGRIVEQGTHQELLTAGGRYAELHALQDRLREVGA